MSHANDEYVTQLERVSEVELVLRRAFRARPETVFDAMTKPDLLRRWWAPRSRGVELFECTTDPRPGGTYRFVFGHNRFTSVAFSGSYLEVVRGERIVYTQVFEPMRAAGEGRITALLEAFPGGTRLVQTERYPSKKALDGALASGMEDGARSSLAQLDEVLASATPAR